MKLIFKYLKKIIIGVFMLFAFNLIANTFNIIVPINFFTIIIVGIFDVPGLIALVFIKLIGM